MIDIEIIKSNYARQSDEWLQQLALSQAETLTDEALSVLFDEFKRRGLNTDVFFDIATRRIAAQNQVEKQAVETYYRDVMDSLWNYAIKRKIEGLSDHEVWQELKSIGADEERATLIIWSLPKKLKKLIDKADTEMLVGAALFILGAFIYLAGKSVRGNISLIPLGMLVGGVLRFAISYSNKEKYKRALRLLTNE